MIAHFVKVIYLIGHAVFRMTEESTMLSESFSKKLTSLRTKVALP